MGRSPHQDGISTGEGLLQAPSGCGWNSWWGQCLTVEPISLQAVGQGWSGAHDQVPAVWPPISQHGSFLCKVSRISLLLRLSPVGFLREVGPTRDNLPFDELRVGGLGTLLLCSRSGT